MRIGPKQTGIDMGVRLLQSQAKLMIAIVYISSAVQPLSDADLEALLAQSREKNGRLKVTGILLYKDGDIMQLIEGPREAVRNLATTIYADRRHQGIIQLLERNISAREFPNWSMEFHELSLSKVEHLAKFLDDEKSLTQGGRLSPTHRLLTSFGWRPIGGK
jgi:hypothetical protein